MSNINNNKINNYDFFYSTSFPPTDTQGSSMLMGVTLSSELQSLHSTLYLGLPLIKVIPYYLPGKFFQAMIYSNFIENALLLNTYFLNAGNPFMSQSQDKILSSLAIVVILY